MARQWYYPYSAVRASDGTLPTKRTYTGQIADETGLYFYNARYYASGLGRFISADTVVPGAGNGMCQGFLDTDGESLVSFDRHSPERGRVLGALIPT